MLLLLLLFCSLLFDSTFKVSLKKGFLQYPFIRCILNVTSDLDQYC